MPCIYFTHCDLGLEGSGFRKYKYSASCLKMPIKKLYRKDTVRTIKGSKSIKEQVCGAGLYLFLPPYRVH